MPFIHQCPHADCGKYMLLEDHARGSSVTCMICKKPVELDPLPAQVLTQPKQRRPFDREASAAQNAARAPRPGEKFVVRACPKCNTLLRVPLGDEKKAMQCTECNYWGLLG